MVIYGLLSLVLFILDVIAGIFGELIPDFPSSVVNILDSIGTMIVEGLDFIGYFFNPVIVVALISLVISWHGFKVIKDAIMKVIGHFIAN